MSAGKLDILIEQGASFELQMTLKDENGDPIDLTGHVFKGQVRKTYSETTVLAEMSFVLADQGTDPGKVTASLSDTLTSAIPVDEASGPDRPLSKYIYDIESGYAGKRYRWLQGSASVSPEVTRA